MARSSTRFLNGVPELLVLRLLQRREMYGYELVREIRIGSDDAITAGEGVIYPCLHALESDRIVSSRRREVDGRSRVYYRLTARGRRHLAKVTAEWQQVVQAVSSVLGAST